MSYIQGIYKKAIFHSNKGYMIGLLKLEDTDNEVFSKCIGKLVTFTGYFHELDEGDAYCFQGTDKEHPRYGLQFEVTSYEKLKPTDKDGIVEFLSSDLFPQIGKKIAMSIVDTLGENVLDDILKDPSCLQLVPKLSAKKADIIYTTLLKYDESHQTFVYLTELGFSMKDALIIYNYYLKQTLSVIETNIFQLVDDLEEISFLKVDQISKNFGFEPLDPRRLKACIVYILKNITFLTGDTYLSFEIILENLCKYIKQEITEADLDQLLSELIVVGRIVREDNNYYLAEMYDATMTIVNKLRILLSSKPKKIKLLKEYVNSLQNITNITYNDKQLDAIESALTENVLIITGGPGTGKTTIIKAIVELYSQVNHITYDKLTDEKLALLAPTGRAAKRLSESTNLPATTIHRFLKWNKETNKFAVNEYDKSNVKFIIIDEVSMIDENLFSCLLKGLTDDIRIVLVGDYNQLPSVSQGQVLKDFIDSKAIKTIELDYLYRQDENSYINTLAHEIKNNQLSSNFIEKRNDYLFLECSASSIKKNLHYLCNQVLEKDYDYKRFQVMAPMYRGENGIDNLNIELQKIFNPADPLKNELKVGEVTYREGDKVLQLVNMPEENVYNGDVGIIKNIVSLSNGKHEIHVEYDYSIVKYTTKDFSNIKHAFIISIHKSQGSEFDLVIMPITNAYHRMLYRKLIYTGITRAKKKLILLGEPNAFKMAVSNEQELIRNTSLKEKIITVHNYLKD